MNVKLDTKEKTIILLEEVDIQELLLFFLEFNIDINSWKIAPECKFAYTYSK